MKCGTAQCSDLVNADDMKGSIMLHWEVDSLCLTASEAAKCAQEAVPNFSFPFLSPSFFPLFFILSSDQGFDFLQDMRRRFV